MTAIDIENTDLWLVLLMLAAGVVSNALLSTDPINLRKLAGDVIRGILVAIVLWAYGIVGHISISRVIVLAGLSAITWPYTITQITRFARRTIDRIFGGR